MADRRRHAAHAWLGALTLVAATACGDAGPGGERSPAPAPSGEAAPDNDSATDDDDANVAEGAFVRSRPLVEVSALWGAATVQAPPDGKTVISAPLAGRVVDVRVREGDRVDKGAPLLEVVLPELARTAAERERAAARLSTLRPRLEQLRALARSGVARAADLAEAEVSVAEADGDRQVAEALLKAAGYRPGDAATLAQRGGRVTLRAPRAGLVAHLAPEMAAGAPFDAQRSLAELAHEVTPRVRAHMAPALLEAGWKRFALITPAADVPLTLVGAAPALDPRDGTRLTWFDHEGDAVLPLGARGWVRPVPTGPTWVVPVGALPADRTATPVVFARVGPKLVPTTVKVLATVGGLAVITGPQTPLTLQVRPPHKPPPSDEGAP
jgi:cobalt-zinc-cadmium efflux system membrane fusion protein